MDIVVLLKQVPATESLIQVAEDGVSIKTDDLKWVINPYDEFAVEEALRIREAQGGTVTILSVGPDKAVEAIRTEWSGPSIFLRQKSRNLWSSGYSGARSKYCQMKVCSRVG